LPSEVSAEPVIYIVDDDESVLRALRRLVQSAGMRAETFASSEDLLSHGYRGEPGCMLLDIQLPGMNGFELHEFLRASGHRPAVVFITAHPERRSRERANWSPAVDFLEKPFHDQALLDAIDAALRLDGEWRHRAGRT
jgi:FixJ family two-component response regulator